MDTAEGDRDLFEPVPHGDLHVRHVVGDRRADDHVVADLEPDERQDRRGEHRPDDGATARTTINDQDTNYNAILPAISSAISTPGDGTSSATPQKVLFFVSDGVADENQSDNLLAADDAGAARSRSNALCTTIKNRGIKIAVLYTTYLPLPTNAWYNT